MSARTIKLFCPSLPKTARFAAPEEERVDLGSIARTFGLDPSTVKLNDHLISRGTDLVASSVTWNSLLSFFNRKGLPTGENDHGPLVVDGKPCKVGAKRRGGHDTQFDDEDTVNTVGCEDIHPLSSKKTRTSNPEFGVSNNRGICSKRKQLLEDLNLFKKLKTNESNTDVQRGSNDLCNNVPRTETRFRCNYLSGHLKRMREDEAVPCKKIR